MEPTGIVMPKYEDSDPDHWQSRWCRDDAAGYGPWAAGEALLAEPTGRA